MSAGGGRGKARTMATDAETLTALKAARSAVIAKMASGQYVTEYWQGAIHIRKASPELLLKAIEDLIVRLEPAADTDRSASVMLRPRQL